MIEILDAILIIATGGFALLLWGRERGVRQRMTPLQRVHDGRERDAYRYDARDEAARIAPAARPRVQLGRDANNEPAYTVAKTNETAGVA